MKWEYKLFNLRDGTSDFLIWSARCFFNQYNKKEQESSQKIAAIKTFKCNFVCGGKMVKIEVLIAEPKQ